MTPSSPVAAVNSLSLSDFGSEDDVVVVSIGSPAAVDDTDTDAGSAVESSAAEKSAGMAARSMHASTHKRKRR